MMKRRLLYQRHHEILSLSTEVSFSVHSYSNGSIKVLTKLESNGQVAESVIWADTSPHKNGAKVYSEVVRLQGQNYYFFPQVEQICQEILEEVGYRFTLKIASGSSEPISLCSFITYAPAI